MEHISKMVNKNIDVVEQFCEQHESTVDEGSRVRLTKSVTETSNHSMKSESGWQFWSRVYDDPELHSQIIQRYQNPSTISELLMNEKFIVTQVVFLNVPNMSHAGKPPKLVVKKLIEKECRKKVIMFDVSVKPKHWLARFYRAEDALEVAHVFNGYLYMNRVLVAKLDQSHSTANGRQLMIGDGLEGMNTLISNSDDIISHSLRGGWSKPERSDIDAYKATLIELLDKKLKGAPGLRMDDFRVTQLGETAGPVSRSILSVWTVGMFRLCAPEVRLRGRYLDLVHQSHKATWKRVIKEAYPSVFTEPWEPVAPSQVKSESQLVEYVCALLDQFGPQRVSTDIVWRVFTTTLCTAVDWPTDPIALMKLVMQRSANFVEVDGFLYGIPNESHRNALADQMLKIPQ